MTDKPVVIMLPGLLSDAVVWQAARQRIEDRYNVLMADLTTQQSITAMAEDSLALSINDLIVIGHSMGARVALEMFNLSPDRIQKLVLFDTGVQPTTNKELPRRKELVDTGYRKGMKALATGWLPPMVHPDRHTDAELMTILNDMVGRMTPEIHEHQIQALIDRPDATLVLPKILIPTLLGVGRQDIWSPLEQHLSMQKSIAGSELVVIEEAGHFAPIERPNRVAGLISNWLD